MKRIITVRGMVIKDGKMYAQRLKTGDGENDFWCTPGGKLDEHESLLDGLQREMIEETGVRAEIGKLLFMQQFDDGENEFLEFFYEIKNADDYEHVDLSATTHGELEVSRHGFIDPKVERVLPECISELDLENLGSQDVSLFSYL